MTLSAVTRHGATTELTVLRPATPSIITVLSGLFLSASFVVVLATDGALTTLTLVVFSAPVVLGAALVALGLSWRPAHERVLVDATTLRIERRGRPETTLPRSEVRTIEAGRSSGRTGVPSRVVLARTATGVVTLVSHLDADEQRTLIAVLHEALALDV